MPNIHLKGLSQEDVDALDHIAKDIYNKKGEKVSRSSLIRYGVKLVIKKHGGNYAGKTS